MGQVSTHDAANVWQDLHDFSSLTSAAEIGGEMEALKVLMQGAGARQLNARDVLPQVLHSIDQVTEDDFELKIRSLQKVASLCLGHYTV